MQPTIIIGGGGHAKVVIEVLRAAGVYEPIGCLDLHPPALGNVAGAPYLGTDEQMPNLYRSGVRCAIVALGDNLVRQVLLDRVLQVGFRLATAVSPMATISPSASLGRGIAVMPGAVVGPDVTIGDGCILNTNASIDHDSQLGHCCHIGPGATLAGRVTVGDLAFVATGSSVIPETMIGANSIVGAGSVVVRDIPDYVVAYGVPAHVHRTIGVPDPEPATRGRPNFRLVS